MTNEELANQYINERRGDPFPNLAQIVAIRLFAAYLDENHAIKDWHIYMTCPEAQKKTNVGFTNDRELVKCKWCLDGLKP